MHQQQWSSLKRPFAPEAGVGAAGVTGASPQKRTRASWQYQWEDQEQKQQHQQAVGNGVGGFAGCTFYGQTKQNMAPYHLTQLLEQHGFMGKGASTAPTATPAGGYSGGVGSGRFGGGFATPAVEVKGAGNKYSNAELPQWQQQLLEYGLEEEQEQDGLAPHGIPQREGFRASQSQGGVQKLGSHPMPNSSKRELFYRVKIRHAPTLVIARSFSTGCEGHNDK
jgi:hypothetical protein